MSKFKSVSLLMGEAIHKDIQPIMLRRFRQLAYPWPHNNFRAIRAQVKEVLHGK